LHLDFDLWLKQAITLLVIACPCALVISTPVAIYAVGNASARGASKRRDIGHGSVKAIALDKPEPSLMDPQTFLMFSPKRNQPPELLACTAGTEILSEHPLAQAIVASRAEGFEPHKAEALKHHGKRSHCKMFGL
jgi:Cd2+/Zn2+-exporting ATPase